MDFSLYDIISYVFTSAEPIFVKIKMIVHFDGVMTSYIFENRTSLSRHARHPIFWPLLISCTSLLFFAKILGKFWPKRAIFKSFKKTKSSFFRHRRPSFVQKIRNSNVELAELCYENGEICIIFV